MKGNKMNNNVFEFVSILAYALYGVASVMESDMSGLIVSVSSIVWVLFYIKK